MATKEVEVVQEGFWKRYSPRNVLLFSLSWLVLMGAVLPMAFVHVVPLHLVPRAGWLTILLVIGLGIVLALPFSIGLILLIRALHEIIRSNFPSKWPLLTLFVVLFFNYLGAALTVTPVLFKQKRYRFAVAGLISLGCFVTMLLFRFSGLGLTATSGTILTCIGVLALFVAASGCPDQRPLRLSCLWPLALTGVYFLGLHAYCVKLDRDLQQGRQELSELIGRSVELSDFLARERTGGLSPTEEPLKTLIDLKMDTDVPDFMTASRDEHLAYVEKVRTDAPDFVAAVEALVKMPIVGVRNDNPEDWITASAYPELTAFRRAARFCCSDLLAHDDDRELVLERCADLEHLRDWSLSQSTLMAKLVAMSIERMYLQALARPLAAGTLTDGDWRVLLARKPDWGQAFAFGFGDEAASFQRIFELALKDGDELREVLGFSAGPGQRMLESLFPRSVYKVMVLRDYRFALNWLKSASYFQDAQGLTAKERTEQVTLGRVRYDSLPFLFTMFVPGLSRVHIKHGEVEAQRQAVAIGVAAASQREQGRWPESLDFLPEEPLDAVNGLPFLCEQGQIKVRGSLGGSKTVNGFRVYAHNNYGQDPGGVKATVAFTIIDREQN